MPDFNPQLAIDLLHAHRQSFGATVPEQDAYIKEVTARLGGRSSEDRREAAKLAVETAKMFLTIAAGVLVAGFVWVQFARTNGVPWISWTLAPFYFASVFFVLSMVFGFLAISHVYKRADGREAPTELAWSTASVADRLNLQSWTGAAGLIALFTGVVMLGLGTGGASVQKPAVSVTIPAQAGAISSSGSLTIEGMWTELRLKTAARQEIRLPQQNLPVTITCQ
jgi:hypothetical protein